MEPADQQSEKPAPQLKLYIYGSRESDQFWLPNHNSHSKRPFCLSDVQEMKVQDEEENDDKDKIYINPLFGKNVFKIACGGMHSVVLTTQGEVFTFGCNDEGALGRKGSEQLPAKVNLQDPIDLISAGDNHSLFANSVNGAIYFAGNYNYLRGEKMTQSIFQPQRTYLSEINYSLRHKRIQKLISGNNHSCVLAHGHLFCRGQPEAFTIGRRMSARHKVQNSLTFNGIGLSHITDVVCGGYHTVVKTKLKDKFKYYSWGKNDSGQLGIGSYEDQAYPSQIKKLKNKDILKMAAGTAFTLFLTKDGEVYGCGSNEDGNLALGEDYVFESSEDEQQKEEKPQKQEMMGDKEEKEQNEKGDQKQGQKGEERQGDLPKQQEKSEEELRKIKMNNIFIKSIRKIDVPELLQGISAGSEYAHGWNKNNLYSWGSGMGYVLLNGQQEDETRPFTVKKKIINEHRIHEVAPGGLHVMYTSYLAEQNKEIKIEPSAKIWQNLTSDRKRLPRRKH